MPARLRACGIVGDTMSATPLDLSRTGWASVRVSDEQAEPFLRGVVDGPGGPVVARNTVVRRGPQARAR